ncbi:MAG: AEC family transporter [Desulfobacterales bacterium]
MQVLSTIIPIFAVVVLGLIARKRGFLPDAFLGPANRLVYYLAIPALIFRAVSRASFRTEFNPTVLLVTLSSAVLAYLGAWLIGRHSRWEPGRIGTFIQCSGHGNHGYIALPIALYFMGESGLARASILAGFLMILQNVLSVLALQTYAVAGENSGRRFRLIGEKLIRNPVIVSALAGVIASLARMPIPSPVLRFLDILSGLAPPMSLLLIGASLSFAVMRRNLLPVLGSVFIKIIAMPAVGLLVFISLRISASDYLPGLILLATPTATVAYVMSREMRGDGEFAVSAISTSTVCSAFTYLVWLALVGSP